MAKRLVGGSRPLFQKILLSLVVLVLVVVLYRYFKRRNMSTSMLSEHMTLPNDEPTFALFYAPWCGHCKNVLPTWKELEQRMDGKQCRVISVNSEEHPDLLEAHGIKGFPTFKWLPYGMNHPNDGEEYNGNRTMEAFIEYMQKKNSN